MMGERERQVEKAVEDLQAGDAFRKSLCPRADATKDGSLLWHGWALMDAFLAGIDYARERCEVEIKQLRGHKEEADRHIATIAQLRHENEQLRRGSPHSHDENPDGA